MHEYSRPQSRECRWQGGACGDGRSGEKLGHGAWDRLASPSSRAETRSWPVVAAQSARTARCCSRRGAEQAGLRSPATATLSSLVLTSRLLPTSTPTMTAVGVAAAAAAAVATTTIFLGPTTSTFEVMSGNLTEKFLRFESENKKLSFNLIKTY